MTPVALEPCTACAAYNYGYWPVSRCVHFNGKVVHWHDGVSGFAGTTICGPRREQVDDAEIDPRHFPDSLAEAEAEFERRDELLRSEA